MPSQGLSSDTASRPLSKEPVVLSHVSSQWRQVALNWGPLWSHIDLFADQFFDPVLLARLEAYASRSSKSLLNIHMIIPAFDLPFDAEIMNSADDTILPFLANVAPRIRSLAIGSAGQSLSIAFYNSVLATCFANCIPGTLNEVSINGDRYDTFVCAHLPKGALAESAIDSLWLSVTNLRLSHCQVEWDSKAFHGLTDLRLTNCNPPRLSELASILQSSPRLQSFVLDQFALSALDYSSPNLIRLDHLEILALGAFRDDSLGPILRLIAPGPSPLTLSIHNPYWKGSEFTSREDLRNFLARSNVTRICVTHLATYLSLAEILSMMPKVRILAVDSFKCRSIDKECNLPPDHTLDSLYVLRSTYSPAFTWRSIEKFVKKHNVRKLTLWEYDFAFCGPGKSGTVVYPDNLFTICPVVNVLVDEEPNPIEGWY